MKHLTAEEARSISESNDANAIAEFMNEILNSVKAAAEKGEWKIKVRNAGFSDGRLYCGEPTATQQALMNQLKELGFKVAIRSEEHQFVDIWLEVSWRK